MESLHRRVLTRRHYDLVKDLDVAHVVDQLIQYEIISIDDDDIIAAESTLRRKARRLLLMIPSRGPKAYSSFLAALHTNFKHLEENLKTCEKEILDEWTEKVKSLLQAEYTESPEEEALTIDLKDIDTFVNENYNIRLPDNELVKVINEVFGCSVFKKGITSNSTVCLRRTHQPTMEDIEGYRHKPMQKWTVSDLRFWLKSLGIPEEVVEWFYHENWGGDAITDVTLAELKSEEIPHLKSGDIYRIIKRRNNVLENENPPTAQSAISASSPVFVTHDTDVQAPVQDTLLSTGTSQEQPTDGGSSKGDRCMMFSSSVTTEKLYKYDEMLPHTEGKQDQLTEASHLFVDEDLSTPNGLYQFAHETLQFACACLNDRTDGTIHFGVASQRTGTPRPGTVVGTRLTNRDNYTKYLRNAVQRCFTPEQQAIVSSCVQDPTFIRVDVPKKDTDIYVVEVNVIPNYISCRDEAFFVRLPRAKPSKGERLDLEKPTIFRWNHGKPSRVAGDELDSFMKSTGLLANKRKQEELKQRQVESGVSETLSKKLVRLLCHGEDDFKGESYPILVINKPDKHMDQSFLQETMSFLNKIQWKAVFDFDPEASVCKFFDSQEERLCRVVMTDDFDPDSTKNVKNPGRLENVKDGIRNSSQCPWIFSNGHNDTGTTHLDPVKWNKEKRAGFRKAVDFFASEIPKGRAMIVHLLLSNDSDVMLEAAQDFHTMFSDQCMCVAENEDIWIPWKRELVHRKCESADVLEERAVIGISWTRVNQTIEMLNGPKRQGECRLPSSSGTYVTIRPHVLQRLEDLEVLGANQCENSEILEDEDACERHRLETEKLFYQGSKADWWNFYFSDHVLRRDKQEELSRAVNFELEELSTDRNHVHTIKMVHQPGSGGTTTAMQTLWEFRKKYRCAVVRKITNDTAKQILDLHSHDDSNPRPVLLLLDNADEEYVPDLKMELEIQSKRMKLGAHEKPKVTCVFLECVRSTKINGKYISLKQELSEGEREWFEKTHSRLEKTYSENSGVHPKLLIAFNIMRTNFDPDYIKAKVKEVIDDIDSCHEKTLLKYVALINAYEVGFDPLPTAAFDVLMNDNLPRPRGKYNTLWETQMSSALRILINEVSSATTGYTRSLRMASPLLSKHVLAELRQQEDGTEQSLSKLVLEFFNDNQVVKQTSQSKKTLGYIVKTMLVTRERSHDGSQVQAFAPLIQTICDDESQEEAIAVIELGYDLLQDAFIAQQISRLHIKTQNWQEALKYAKLSTDQISNNSYLWDTYGRVYLEQEFQHSKKTYAGKQSMEDVGRLVEIAVKGIDKFQKGQKVTENEKNCNDAVYLNELKLTVTLLDYLAKTGVFGDKDNMRKCLTGESEMPRSMLFLEDFNGEDYSSKLKKMHSDVFKTMVYLDDRNLQITRRPDNQSQKNHEQLAQFKRRFYEYFVEPAAKDLSRLSANKPLQYRRCQLYAYQSYALGNIFERELSELLKMKKLVTENIDNASYANADDLRVLISVNLALSERIQHDETTSMYDSMSQYSCNLYEQRHKLPLMYLEAYLFYVMFNWPRENVKSSVHPQLLEESLPLWREAFFRKYPKANDARMLYRNKPTTKFFLANGSGMKSLFCYKRADRKKEEEFWRAPEVLKKLQRFRGILIDDGCYVQLGHDMDERRSLKIPTSFPIRYEYMWNKQVYFVVGFSWDGPKAFDVDCENPAVQPHGSSSV